MDGEVIQIPRKRIGPFGTDLRIEYPDGAGTQFGLLPLLLRNFHPRVPVGASLSWR